MTERPFTALSRSAWSRRSGTGVHLDAGAAGAVARATSGDGLPDLHEIGTVYVPLAAMVARRAQRWKGLSDDAGLGAGRRHGPFVVGIAGPVGVGKSTTAGILQALLVTAPWSPAVVAVATDGFLHPNAELEGRGLLDRKGFPESYDGDRLQAFMVAVRAGEPGVTAPVYSHERYDVVDDDLLVVDRPDILLLEGLHVLAGDRDDGHPPTAVDFGVYLDAEHADVADWHLERCLELYRRSGGAGRYGLLSEEEMTTIARWAWDEINQPNLDLHIAPTRSHADVVLVKAADHRVRQVLLADQSASRSTVTPTSSSRVTRLTVAPSVPGSDGEPE